MNEKTKQAVQENLFHAARLAIKDWESFPWHRDGNGKCDTWKLHSSQALAIDVFGSLKSASHSMRTSILDRFASSIGLPAGGPWCVDLEWQDPENRLREKTKTQVDAMARSPNCVILFECKFTETEAGSCSQTQSLMRKNGTLGPKQCNGNYEIQVNPVNAIENHCVLSGKGIRYWEIIPEAFWYDANISHIPCPFRGDFFQLMRNVVLAWQIAQDERVTPAFVTIYADSPMLPFPEWIGSPEWQRFTQSLRPQQIVCRAVSYQAFIDLAIRTVEDAGEASSLWRELGAWIDRKLTTVVATRSSPPAKSSRTRTPKTAS